MAATITTDNRGSSPEFLINQKTLSCLSVIGGSGTDDAVIGMERCNGSVNQQWFCCNGQWQWGGNRNLCLAPKGNKKGDVHLVPCESATAVWTLDTEDRLVTGSLSLGVRVALPSNPVRLWPQKGGLNKKWWTFTSLEMNLEDAELAEHCFPPEVMAICKKATRQAKKQKLSEQAEKENEEDSENESEGEGDIAQETATAETPEYLINQSSHMCLTVIKGATPKNAVIGVEPYNGRKKQQWFVKDGQWQWGRNREVCLNPDLKNKKVGLAKSNESSASWHFDKSGLLMIESHALEIPLEGDKSELTLNPKNGKLNQKWWTVSSLKPYIGKRMYPFSPQDKKIYKQELMRGLMNRLAPLSEPLPYPRDISRYPGTVASSTPRVNRVITLDLTVLGQRKGIRMRAPPKDWQATSAYVVAGDLFSVILPETMTAKQASQIKVRVGAQSDNLNPNVGKVSKGKNFRRMPIVSDVHDVKPGVNILRSQYGGNLIFKFREGENFKINIEVHNIVEAPHFIIHKTSDEEWKKMKELDVPYSILEGERVVVVAPTTAAKKTPDPKELLNRYDNVVSIIEDLAGFDETDTPPRGKHWLVDDIQISAGSAHAGFPIMFERRFNNIASPDTPHSWVVWHELGHNYQQPRIWSNVYGSEATVNLFSLYIQEKLMGTSRLVKNDSYSKVAEEIDNGLTFSNGKCGAKLVFIMEIYNAYPQRGWDMFRHLNKTTRALSPEEAQKIASSKQQQIDYVYKVLSRYIGADLFPQYQRWGITISKEALHQIQQLGLPKSPSDLSVRPKAD